MASKCYRCFQPRMFCDCASFAPLRLGFKPIILCHPDESRRTVATGRLAASVLPESLIWEGISFSQHPGFCAVLADPSLRPVLLYPGPDAQRVEALHPAAESKTLAIIIVDGTWATAKQMLRLTPELWGLEQVELSPQQPSQFRIRRQPRAECLSTIEAIAAVARELGRVSEAAALEGRLRSMVERQIEFFNKYNSLN